jgi:Flp pilus assembly pilin Flp
LVLELHRLNSRRQCLARAFLNVGVGAHSSWLATNKSPAIADRASQIPPPGDEAMKTFLSRFSKKQSGVTLDEYALIAALVWVAIMIGVQVVSAGTPSGTVKTDQSKLH